MSNPVLYLHLESNKNKGGGGGGAGQPNKMLEQESIRCVKSWRTFGGPYKDIDIIIMCVTNNPPLSNTIVKLNELGCFFHQDYHRETDWFPAGWWATPLGGRIIEQEYDYDKIIHIDLDMMLIRELKEDIIHIKDDHIAKCSVYSEGFEDDKQIDPNWKKTFVTCFIVSSKESEFYNKWYYRMLNMGIEYHNIFYDEINGIKQWKPDDWWDYCNLEEHAVDLLYYVDGHKIEKVEKIQIGPSQGYESVGDLTDEELLNVYFFHNHFDNVDEHRRSMREYARRMVKLGQIKK